MLLLLVAVGKSDSQLWAAAESLCEKSSSSLWEKSSGEEV
jgi:hypothetical protein